jgi:hypothetical protein
MTTPPGWEPRPGPTRGDPARRAPRGPGGLAHDNASSRRQGGRGGAPAGGRGWEAGPSFTPGRAPGPRDGGSGGPRAPRGGQGRPFPNSEGNDRGGSRPDDFAARPRPVGEGLVDRNGPVRDQIGSDGFRAGDPSRWLGRMSTRTALLVLIAGALLGVIVTLVAGQEPGGLLGFFIIAGAIAAGLGIRRGKVYLLFPAPALAFFVAAIVTGKVHDAKLGSSTAGLGAGFTQWVAGIFFPAVVATIVVLLIGGGRWVLGRQLVIGQSPLPVGRPAPGNARPAPGSRRPAVDDWADDNPFDDPPPRSTQTGASPGQGTGPAPRQGTGPAPRQGTGPAPRQGTGPAPRQGTGPAPRQGTGPAPRQGTGPAPRQGTGPAPRQGTGPAPRQGTGPAPRQGTGPDPRQGTGPAPRQGTGSAPRQGTGSSPSRQGNRDGARPSRPPRDQRTDRDPWGDPRLPADRSQPTSPRPNGQGRPAAQSQPNGSGARPSWNPAPSPAPQRSPRRQSPEGWAQR